MAERSKAWVCSGSPARIAGSNPAGGMDVCCECCVLSGRVLCDGPIPRPEESYRLWLCDCDHTYTGEVERGWTKKEERSVVTEVEMQARIVVLNALGNRRAKRDVPWK